MNYFLNFRLEAMRNGEETPILDTIVFRKIRILLGGKMRLMLAGKKILESFLFPSVF